MTASINTNFWCERVRTCFSLFVKDPGSLQHLMLFGPPGSGKTTSAAWLVEQIWGDRKALMCMSMNAADERSLESIRQKVYPFIGVDWREANQRNIPRFLILDECETLTEAAQLSLQTVLSLSPLDVCTILICNSQSRIHPKLRQRLFKIRYDPPSVARHISTSAVDDVTRGDLRQQCKQSSIEKRLFSYIYEHPSNLPTILKDPTIDLHAILIELIVLCNKFNCLNEQFLSKVNSIIVLLEISQPDNQIIPKLAEVILEFRALINLTEPPHHSTPS